MGAPRPTPSASTSRFTPGAIIGGRYRLVALLGRGGMGEVYRADDLTLDQPIALKFLPDGVAAPPHWTLSSGPGDRHRTAAVRRRRRGPRTRRDPSGSEAAERDDRRR